MDEINLHYKPRLRPLDALPAEIEGEKRFVIRDPARWSEEVLALPEASMYILSLMDGMRTIAEIESYLEKNLKISLKGSLVKFVQELDAAGFLESKTFQEKVRAKKEAYEQSPVRKPICSGSAYPEDKKELLRFIKEMVGEKEPFRFCPDGIISPHIDYYRGRQAYRSLWSKLDRKQHCPEAVVIFGTSHYDGENLLSLSTKPYATPLGTSPLFQPLVSSLKKKLGDWVTDGSFSHSNEHSIELQVALLHYLFGEIPIVPLLCGPVELFYHQSRRFLAETLVGIKEWWEESQKRFSLLAIAGADLSHVGTMFGDRGALSSQDLAWIKEKDEESLKLALCGDSLSFFHHVLEDQAQRKVCGLAPIFFLVYALSPLSGECLDYQQWVDEKQENTVTFASAVLYQNKA